MVDAIYFLQNSRKQTKFVFNLQDTFSIMELKATENLVPSISIFYDVKYSVFLNP